MYISKCIICNSQVVLFCDLGNQYPANSLGSSDKYPLAVTYCKNCYHVQLNYVVDRKLLFDNYTYISGVSQHLRTFWKELRDQITLNTGCSINSILDIASNDGSFLEAWDCKVRVGIEPCSKISSLCKDKSIEIINGYFPNGVSLNDKFDVITALNVLAHVSNPIEFLDKCKNHLNSNGSIWVMTSQADMIENGQFDTIYHEHISYFSTLSFFKLAQAVGLTLTSITKVSIHGGSYLVQFKHGVQKRELNSGTYLSEKYNGRYTAMPYLSFNSKKNTVVERISRFANDYKTLIGIGASAKANVVMQASGIYPDVVFDENPNKVGRRFPTGVLIESQIDTSILFKTGIINYTWNFFNELWPKLHAQLTKNSVFGEIMSYFPEYKIESYL